ncbi:MAG: acetylxylan esterase [Acidobacteria bacterium]|nr:acetylxylan esterase [Acidobacteriota bacterium]
MKLAAALCPLFLTAAFAQEPTLDFLTNQTDGRGLRDMLPNYLKQQVRQRHRATPASPDEFRAGFLKGLGGLPDRTPLNARVTGTLQRDGYRVEKIVFESQPGFYVTANLYLPTTGAAPYPAILFPIGHEPGAKAYPVWQQILATFARRGFVALTWDQNGQGERIQHWDEALQGSKVPPSTTEHTIMGIQCLAVGDSLARYTIWDATRALDYLLSRPEVDKSRIGLTGNSGGGTHTAYLGALDPRIHVAAPSCFITSWQRLLETIGPQDAEQCIPGFLSNGFEHADFIRAFAPKPYMMLSAIRDFFSIQGARSAFEAVKPAYAPAPEKFAMTETDEGHGYTAELRLASYQWFSRWLQGRPAPAGDPPVAPATVDELAVTKTGQVATTYNGETVYTLNRARARALNTPAATTRDIVRRRIQWREETRPPVIRPYGHESRGGLNIEKFLYESEPGIVVPAVLVSAAASTTALRPGVVLVSARGKRAAWAEIQALARRGAAVLAIDARGFGETRPLGATKGDSWTSWFGDYDSAMTSVLLDTSLAAQRAYDIQRAFYLLAARPGVDRNRIHGAAQGNAAPALLHAAAAGVPFKDLILDQMVASYSAIVENPVHRAVFEGLVPGALKDYDLPALAALHVGRIVLIDLATPLGAAMPAGAVKEIYPKAQVHVRQIEEPEAAAYARLID